VNQEGVAVTVPRSDHVHAFTGVGLPPLIPGVDCTNPLGENVTPLRWNGAYLCGPVHIENRANLNALVIGGVAEEGGDTYVFSNNAGDVCFGVDADLRRVGCGIFPFIAYRLTVWDLATENLGQFIGGEPYSGTSPNYGLVCSRAQTVDTTTGYLSAALNFLVTNPRHVDGDFAVPMVSRAITGSVTDSGDIVSVTDVNFGVAREAVGSQVVITVSGTDTNQDPNGFAPADSFNIWGVRVEGNMRPTINTAGLTTTTCETRAFYCDIDVTPILTVGTAISISYGAYLDVNVNPSADAGTHTAYGVYAYVRMTTEGASTAYGVYGSAAGADVNWAGYFIDADVYVQQRLEIDGALDLDGSIDTVGMDVGGAGAGVWMRSIPVTTSVGAGWIYVHNAA